jgi:hypothetical protein
LDKHHREAHSKLPNGFGKAFVKAEVQNAITAKATAKNKDYLADPADGEKAGYGKNYSREDFYLYDEGVTNVAYDDFLKP